MDSDEEHERRPRGRDKFRRERSDYNDRSGRRDDRSSRREDWSDRRRPVWDSRRKNYRDFDRDRRDSGGRHHDQISPPMKRGRRDWDNVGYQGDGYGGYNPMMTNQWVSPMDIQQGIHQRPFDTTQRPVDSGPLMMSFKQFLNSMDDNIDDMESVKKYQEYKVDFRKTQIADFFTTHKDEEWFRNKYHPDDSLSYKKKVKAAVRKRAAVFVNMLQSGWFEKYSLTAGQGEDIIKLLDAAVIKFEGGTDFDLQVLDKPVEQEVKNELSSNSGLLSKNGSQNENIGRDARPISPSSVPLPETPAPPSASVKNAGFKAQDIKPLEMSDPTPEQVKLREEAEKYHQQQLQREQQQETVEQQPPQQQKVQQEQGGQKRKRKRRHREPYYYDENGESESESESDFESEPAPPGEESVASDAQERAAEESLLPPGVETEPISADEVMVGQGGAAAVTIQPPGTEENQDSAEPKIPKVDKGSEDAGADMEKETDKKKEFADETAKTNVTLKEEVAPIPEQQGEGKSENVESVKEEAALEMGEAEANESNTIEKDSIETVQQEGQESGVQVKRKESESEEKMDTSESGDVKATGEESKETEKDEPEPPKEPAKPRALHQTLSLFVRNVPPKISHNDITSVCSRFPGFMRVVLSDPAPDRKFSRRGWITFKPDVKIQDICWTINNIKIKEIELNPIVNRELARRVRTVSGAAVLKDLVKTDINMAKKLIQQLDEKFELWKNDEEEPLKKMEEKTTGEEKNETEKPEESSEAVAPTEEPQLVPKETKVETVEPLPKTNPVLASLPASLSEDSPGVKEESKTSTGDEEGQIIEEGQVSDGGKDTPAGQTPAHPPPEVDGDLVNVLDRLLLYLRIVHSLDYYTGAEYLYEDDMPNRCGIINIRNPLPEKVNYGEVTGWHKNLHQKLDQHLQEKKHLSDEDADKLGKKNQDQEMDKFIQANTQELAPDKWLCPLSGKKFRGPEFVKKHIFNKHADKVEAVKTEICFFNNFVYDPDRPSEQETRASSQSTPGGQPFPGGVTHPVGMSGGMGWGRGGGGGMMQPVGRGGFSSSHVTPNYRSGPDQYNNRGTHPPKARRGFGRRDPRQIVEYKDLDAPGDDPEFF